MSDDPKDKSDITRIEDLGEFEHDEEDLDEELDDQNENSYEVDSQLESFEEEDLDDNAFDNFQNEEEEEQEEGQPEDDQEFSQDLEPNLIDEQDDFPNLDNFLDDDQVAPEDDHQEDSEVEPTQELEPPTELEASQDSETNTPDPVTEKVFEPSKDIAEISTSLNAISYGELPSPGNPPYSLKITQIKYQEDTEYIVDILQEYNLINENNKDDYLLSLQKGTLLVPRISEYLAITLANKLRVVQADMVMGLAHEIQTSELFNETERGLISKSSVNMNYEKNSAHQGVRTSQEDILLSTSAIPFGYQIERHLGIATETTLLDMSQFPAETENLNETFEVLTESGQRSHPLNHVYSKLSQNLKTQAFKQFGNGIVNLKYEVHPIVSDADPRLHYYQVLCTGDIVVLKSEE